MDKRSGWSLITWALYGGGSSHSTMLNRTKSGQLSFTASAAALSLVFCHWHQVFFVYQVINSNDVLLLSFVPEPRLLLCRFGRTPSPRLVFDCHKHQQAILSLITSLFCSLHWAINIQSKGNLWERGERERRGAFSHDNASIK